MYEIEYHHSANEEMKDAAAHYEGRVTGLGDEFLDEIEQGLIRIQQFPLRWSIYEGEYRRLERGMRIADCGMKIRKIPHSAIRIPHSIHRKPGYWKARN